MRLTEKNSRPNRRAFRGLKARHPELEKRLCDYVDDKRQYGCTVTSEMCQTKALAVSKELGIMGFKATLHLCQEAPGERVLTANSGVWRGNVQPCLAPAHRASLYLRETHCSYNIRGDRRVSSSKFIL